MDGLIIEFCYPAPFYSELYESLFDGCTLRFNQALTQIKLPANWLNEPISLERSKIDLLLSRKLIVDYEQSSQVLTPIERKISEVVIGSHFTKCNARDIASEFSMTQRQLRYYLQRAGVSLRDIVLRARMSVAARLLVDTELEIGTIAETLNYSEASAFVRSYKTYHAISPLQYRRRKNDPFKHKL